MTTFAPDTPAHVLSDWVEEHARDYGFTTERNTDGKLIVTVPARPDGLPNWYAFLMYAKQLQGADGWVMEGAMPERYDDQADWWCKKAGRQSECWHVIDCVYELLHQDDRYKARYYGGHCDGKALADLSRACVEYSRSGGGK